MILCGIKNKNPRSTPNFSAPQRAGDFFAFFRMRWSRRIAETRKTSETTGKTPISRTAGAFVLSPASMNAEMITAAQTMSAKLMKTRSNTFFLIMEFSFLSVDYLSTTERACVFGKNGRMIMISK
jgi:hypothetical protein